MQAVGRDICDCCGREHAASLRHQCQPVCGERWITLECIGDYHSVRQCVACGGKFSSLDKHWRRDAKPG